MQTKSKWSIMKSSCHLDVTMSGLIAISVSPSMLNEASSQSKCWDNVTDFQSTEILEMNNFRLVRSRAWLRIVRRNVDRRQPGMRIFVPRLVRIIQPNTIPRDFCA